MTQLSPNVLAIARRSLTPTQAMRDAARAVLDAEYAAAREMPDDVFWNYDAAWLGLGAPELVNAQRPGAGGGGGANMSWDNNQFWNLAQQCDRGLFTLVMYQQRRYIAAQIRIARHLAAVPQPEIVQGFDNLAAGGVRASCSGVEVRAKASEWAYWCEEAVRLIGVARWASNFSWSDSSKTCGDYGYRLDAQPIVGAYDTGCRYIPDCSTDPLGVARLGYVAGAAPNGILRWESIVAPYTPRATQAWVNAARAAWPLRWDSRHDLASRNAQGGGTPPGFGADWPISISPRALSLHKSSRTRQAPASEVPTNANAFDGAWAKLGLAPKPPFIAGPAANGLGDWLLAYFLEQPTDIERYQAQRALREQTGCWFWHYADDTGGAGVAHNIAYPSPASEIIIWRFIAHLRDILAKPFGQVVIDGFTNLERAVEGIPAQFRGTAAEALGAVHSAANAVRGEQAAVVGAAFSAAGGAAAAINPIAGIVVGVLGALTSALVAFSIDIGLARGSNPPALQMPALRAAPSSVTGDDRCMVNQGPLESLSAYQVRVTAPYAEGAQRAGGDPGALFDIIPQVRFQQFCQQNPGAPECQVQPPPAAATPWAKYLLGAGGSAAGYLLIKLLGG